MAETKESESGKDTLLILFLQGDSCFLARHGVGESFYENYYKKLLIECNIMDNSDNARVGLICH